MNINNDYIFNKWLELVNRHIYSRIKINLTDLPDNTFRIDFDNGLSPEKMAQKVVKDTEWEELYST
jgi:hypothetical protein